MIVGTYYNEKKKNFHEITNMVSIIQVPLIKKVPHIKKKNKTLWTNKLFNIDITSN